MQTHDASQAPTGFRRSCGKCGHVKVCTLFRAIAPLLGNWEEGHRPFEAADLAAVCTEYSGSTSESNL